MLGAGVGGADLTGADLTAADLPDTDLTGADLTERRSGKMASRRAGVGIAVANGCIRKPSGQREAV